MSTSKFIALAAFLLSPPVITCGLAKSVSVPTNEMKKYTAPDSSYVLYKPQEWEVRASSEKASVRIVFTSIAVMPHGVGYDNIAQGVIQAPYLPPSQILPVVFAKLGDRDVKVLAYQPHQGPVQSTRGPVPGGRHGSQLDIAGRECLPGRL